MNLLHYFRTIFSTAVMFALLLASATADLSNIAVISELSVAGDSEIPLHISDDELTIYYVTPFGASAALDAYEASRASTSDATCTV